MKVLIACEYSGRVRDAFAAIGHDAWSCDILDTDVPGQHHKGSVLDILGDDWDLMVAHPPCTRLANSGVRWLHERNLWKELDEAAEFYKALRDAPIPRKAIENPVMHKYARERLGSARRQVVQPWWFGEKTFKATGFELIGLPDLIPTNILKTPATGTDEHKTWSWVHRCPPGPNRWKIRSTTALGIAFAMAAQWGGSESMRAVG
tara:strand:- start:131 stop:745 length:615 start_codon:yes stop_codon:yes gene_type:complete